MKENDIYVFVYTKNVRKIQIGKVLSCVTFRLLGLDWTKVIFTLMKLHIRQEEDAEILNF